MTDNPSGGPAPAPPIPPTPTPPSEPPKWEPAPAPPAPPVPSEAYPRRHGLGVGIALIVIGLIVLASWFVPGLAWWTLWPLLIVVAGIVQVFTPSRHAGYPTHNIFDGVGTVIFGIVLLGCTTGYVSWSMWWVLLTLWPVLLIAGGIAIIGRGLQQTWLRALAPIVVWLAVLYAASVSLTGQGGLQPLQVGNPAAPWYALGVRASGGQPFSFSQPLGDTTSATLDLEAGAGDITVGPGSELIAVKGTTPFGTPSFSVNHSGGGADVHVGMGNQNTPVIWPGSVGGQMDVKLSKSVLWDATVSTGASSLDADLSSVRVRSVMLKSGVNDATLKLGEVPDGSSHSDAVVKSGVSSINILVPKDAEVRVDTHNGLTTTSVDSSLQHKSTGVWETAGYSSASKAWNIQIESGVSTVSIKTY